MDIERLRRLDPKAASYVESCYHKETIESTRLDCLFCWADTPQGDVYWRALNKMLTDYEKGKAAMEKPVEKTLQKSTAIGLHRQMWHEISDCRLEKKDDSQLWAHNGGLIEYDSILNNCFLCEYVKQKTGSLHMSPLLCRDHCPLSWPSGQCEHGGLFDLWKKEHSPSIAKNIALLPELDFKKVEPVDKKIFLAVNVDDKEIIGERVHIKLSDAAGNYYMGDGDSNGSNLMKLDLPNRKFHLSQLVNKAAQRVSGLNFDEEGRLVS